jgi:hypothetical protein
MFINFEMLVILMYVIFLLAILQSLEMYFGSYVIARHVLAGLHKKNGAEMIAVKKIIWGKLEYQNNAKECGGPFTEEWYLMPIIMDFRGPFDKAAHEFRCYAQWHGFLNGPALQGLSDLGQDDVRITRRIGHALVDRKLDVREIDAIIFEMKYARENRGRWLYRIFNN